MKGITLHESKISEVLNEARLFAIRQTSSRAPDWITVRREVFEQLIAIAGLALEALTALTLSEEQLTARTSDGNYVVELSHAILGDVRGEGRTLLGAMVEAKLERQRQIAPTATC